jgi:hypothetical protein
MESQSQIRKFQNYEMTIKFPLYFFQVLFSLIHAIIHFSFLKVLGFGTQGVKLAREALYHLSHAPNPFCFEGYFFW